jgi:CRP-like cAMP-binding protein
MIFQAGHPSSGLYLVKSGQVKLSILAPSGSERVIEVIATGGIFGESIVFSESNNRLNAEMLRKGELIEIPQKRVKQALEACPSLATAMTHYMSTRICCLLSELEKCCLCTARQRVVDYLLMLLERQSGVIAAHASVMLPASKGVIASLLDITPETFSRELNRLMGLGLIEVDRKQIRIVDLPGMQMASQATD